MRALCFVEASDRVSCLMKYPGISLSGRFGYPPVIASVVWGEASEIELGDECGWMSFAGLGVVLSFACVASCITRGGADVLTVVAAFAGVGLCEV